ncbi:hypothetical protein FRC10_004599 [Ceratobasidium sp. 414]|nr:hypothetical protein FRC10_004599 [Ceratobasidium sp. 414]
MEEATREERADMPREQDNRAEAPGSRPPPVTIEEIEDEGKPPHQPLRPPPCHPVTVEEIEDQGEPPRVPSQTPPRHPVTIEEIEDEGKPPHAPSRTPPRHPVTVEEIEDESDNPVVVDTGGEVDGECGAPVVEEFNDPRAGAPIDDSRAQRFDLRAYMKSVGRFASPKDFEVAELLLTTKMTNASRDEHLKSRKYRGQTPWPNVGALMKAVDTLPVGPPWKAVTLNVTEGDNERLVVVYIRDIIGVIRELMGNPRFKRHMHYAPE